MHSVYNSWWISSRTGFGTALPFSGIFLTLRVTNSWIGVLHLYSFVVVDSLRMAVQCGAETCRGWYSSRIVSSCILLVYTRSAECEEAVSNITYSPLQISFYKQFVTSPTVHFRYHSTSSVALFALRPLRWYHYSVQYLAEFLVSNSGQAEKQTVVMLRINRSSE
jgi:hypothetical protein